MTTKTAVIDLIEAIVQAAGVPLTRGDVNYLATAALGTQPLVDIADILDPPGHMSTSILVARAQKIRAAVLAADEDTIRRMVNFDG